MVASHSAPHTPSLQYILFMCKPTPADFVFTPSSDIYFNTLTLFYLFRTEGKLPMEECKESLWLPLHQVCRSGAKLQVPSHHFNIFSPSWSSLWSQSGRHPRVPTSLEIPDRLRPPPGDGQDGPQQSSVPAFSGPGNYWGLLWERSLIAEILIHKAPVLMMFFSHCNCRDKILKFLWKILEVNRNSAGVLAQRSRM